jgi:hypothetical protein
MKKQFSGIGVKNGSAPPRPDVCRAIALFMIIENCLVIVQGEIVPPQIMKKFRKTPGMRV